MHKKTITLQELPESKIPLGFRKVFTKTIPSAETEKKFSFYNRRFKQLFLEAAGSQKPISKIIQE